jgi:hypothetical protein
MSTVVIENPNPAYVVVKDSSSQGSVTVSNVTNSVSVTGNQTVVVTETVYSTPIDGGQGDTVVISSPAEFIVEVGAQGPQGAEGPQGPAGSPGASSQDVEVVIRNNTGATLLKGQVVYVTGALGQKPTVGLASASGEMTSSKTFGIVKANINNNSEGTIVNFGLLEGINTNAFNEGNALWLSATPGAMTNVRPTQPNHGVSLGWVLKKAGGDGSIFVQIQNGFELHELHTVLLTSEKDGDVLQYDGLTDLWKNKAPDKSPVFTYTAGLLTRVDYASGNYKTLAYTAGVLNQVVYVLPGRTVTKVFTYNLDGSLASISQSEVYN